MYLRKRKDVLRKMAQLEFDTFELWIRDRSRGCLDELEIEDLCRGEMDFETGEYTFLNQSVQSQWEAWQESARLARA